MARPLGEFKTTSDYQYQLLKCNCNLLKLIQLGITFYDKTGSKAPGLSTFQFNFKFNLGYVTCVLVVFVCAFKRVVTNMVTFWGNAVLSPIHAPPPPCNAHTLLYAACHTHSDGCHTYLTAARPVPALCTMPPCNTTQLTQCTLHTAHTMHTTHTYKLFVHTLHVCIVHNTTPTCSQYTPITHCTHCTVLQSQYLPHTPHTQHYSQHIVYILFHRMMQCFK